MVVTRGWEGCELGRLQRWSDQWGQLGLRKNVKNIVGKLWLTKVDPIFQNGCIYRTISDITIKDNCIC